jgi:acetyltransferase-like isoleucine patch superfamily enzyme
MAIKFFCKIMRTVKDLILGIRLYIFNKFINRIPFACIRLWLMKKYIIIGRNSNVLLNVELLNNSMDKNCVVIGENCIINSRTLLDGRVGRLVIGNNVDIARETNIFTLEHSPNSDDHGLKPGDVFIEDYVWIASRVTILPGVRIGRGAVVASNAVVTKDVEPMSIVAGIPARKIGERKSVLNYTLNYFPFFK